MAHKCYRTDILLCQPSAAVLPSPGCQISITYHYADALIGGSTGRGSAGMAVLPAAVPGLQKRLSDLDFGLTYGDKAARRAAGRPETPTPGRRIRGTLALGGCAGTRAGTW